jgi:hypothetical protein
MENWRGRAVSTRERLTGRLGGVLALGCERTSVRGMVAAGDARGMASSSRATRVLPSGWVEVNFRMSGGPATSMGMAAEALSADKVRLPRAPWSAFNAAKGDIFRVRPDADGELWVEEKLEASGWCAIDVWVESDGPFGPVDDRVNVVLDKFAPLGVTGTGMFWFAVLDVPPDADLAAVRRLLDKGKHDGWWEYGELCVTDAWKAATSR